MSNEVRSASVTPHMRRVVNDYGRDHGLQSPIHEQEHQNRKDEDNEACLSVASNVLYDTRDQPHEYDDRKCDCEEIKH